MNLLDWCFAEVYVIKLYVVLVRAHAAQRIVVHAGIVGNMVDHNSFHREIERLV